MHALFITVGLFSVIHLDPSWPSVGSISRSPDRCPREIEDASAPGNCISASSVPTLGALYPLSTELCVTPPGDIGIGTSAPAAGVDVHVLRTVGEALLRLTTNAVHGNVAGLQVQASGKGWTIGTGANDFGGIGGLGFRTFAGSTAMVLCDGGSVGIGTTLPAAKLEVAGAGNTVARVSTSGSYPTIAGFQIAQAGNNGWTIGMGHGEYGGLGGIGFRNFLGNTAMVIANSGWVGLGTLTPQARLDVDGETATDTLRIRGGSDVVERFASSSGDLEAGSVVALDPDHTGKVIASSGAYDRKVIGVVSGAGGVKPGIELSQQGVLDGDVQVAMMGRVYVKCTTENGPVEVGDQLTTAARAGYAMKATDAPLAFGSVIGKAASALDAGTGLVLVVVNLQ